jgi:hypothetical protein
MSANEKQVGGEHYKGTKHEHWDVVYELGWCYLVGGATKYLWRLGRKGDEEKKIEDIKKAIHFLEKKVEQLEEELADEEALNSMLRAPEAFQKHLAGEEPGPGYVNQD